MSFPFSPNLEHDDEQFRQVDGARLYYELSGSGSPVVLINPGALDCRVWDDQWQTFTARHGVIRYDPRGWGRSDRPEGEFS